MLNWNGSVEDDVWSWLLFGSSLDLPERLGAVWADETATPYRSSRAAAGNRPCDRPRLNTPGSALCALHSDTEQDRNDKMKIWNIIINIKKNIHIISIQQWNAVITSKLSPSRESLVMQWDNFHAITVIPAVCVLDVLQQSPGLRWWSCSAGFWVDSPLKTCRGGKLPASRRSPETSGRNSVQRQILCYYIMLMQHFVWVIQQCI